MIGRKSSGEETTVLRVWHRQGIHMKSALSKYVWEAPDEVQMTDPDSAPRAFKTARDSDG